MFQNFVGNKKKKMNLKLEEDMALLEINHDDIKFGSAATPKPQSKTAYSKKF